MNLLFFNLKTDFEEVSLVANNEVDLENYLKEKGYTNIQFRDLRKSYGVCYLTTEYDNETAECFYVTKI